MVSTFCCMPTLSLFLFRPSLFALFAPPPPLCFRFHPSTRRLSLSLSLFLFLSRFVRQVSGREARCCTYHVGCTWFVRSFGELRKAPMRESATLMLIVSYKVSRDWQAILHAETCRKREDKIFFRGFEVFEREFRLGNLSSAIESS